MCACSHIERLCSSSFRRVAVTRALAPLPRNHEIGHPFARRQEERGGFILLGKRWTYLTGRERSTSLYEKLGTPGSPEREDIDETSHVSR